MAKKIIRKKHRLPGNHCEYQKSTLEQDFEKKCKEIRELFSKCSAFELFLALNISDLWLPNVASQVKHALFYSIAFSIQKDDFGSKTLGSYSEFQKFINAIYDSVPDFSTLEDFTPETDWGEIRLMAGRATPRIFYGGPVERIPDYITAFYMLQCKNPKACQDMDLTIWIQSQIISRIEKKIAGQEEKIENGQLKVPSEEFWSICRSSMISISKEGNFERLSNCLVGQLGTNPIPSSYINFGNSILSGSAVTKVLVDLKESILPIAIRNSSSAVIQYWANKQQEIFSDSITTFLSNRFPHCINGPLAFLGASDRCNAFFSAVVFGGSKPYIFLALPEKELGKLPEIEAGLRRITSSEDWGICNVATRESNQIRSKNGQLPTFEQLEIIVVVTNLDTTCRSITLPKCDSKILFLPDFVTIFDYIDDLGILDKFWDFKKSNRGVLHGFLNTVDLFASFIDSHSLLVEGALNPTMIALDTSWGNDWRYKKLKEFWEIAPPMLPDVPNTAWQIKENADGLYRIIARGLPIMCFGTVVNSCTVYFVLEAGSQKIERQDGEMLELLSHCLADSLNQRKSFLKNSELFRHTQIITHCKASMDSLISNELRANTPQDLFLDWEIKEEQFSQIVHLHVSANLKYIQNELSNAKDAKFEVEALSKWFVGASYLLHKTFNHEVLEDMKKTTLNRPRFYLTIIPRRFDVPDHFSPFIPDLEHYKIARRDLAIVFKNIGAEPGEYELESAKKLIDDARERYRIFIHDKISKFNKFEISKSCIFQIDTLISQFDYECKKIQVSLNHEVDYDRKKYLADKNEEFVKITKNYRYLLEASLSINSAETGSIKKEEICGLIGSIDWLLVLYNASDVLYNGLDIAGLRLSESFIPEIIYSDLSEKNQLDFSIESAEERIGIGLNPDDEISEIRESDPEWLMLEQAFNEDNGIELHSFFGCLKLLSSWASANENEEIKFLYSAPIEKITNVLKNSIPNLSQEMAEKVIELLILRPDRIRRLINKTVDEIDVPVWEHNKRDHRYTIKPLVQDEEGMIHWGAATVDKSASIWFNCLTNGYLPADYQWPNTKKVIAKIKEKLDKELEKKSAEILNRTKACKIAGIDFMRRFPKDGIEDVGDFDGLAYWPQSNIWLIAECKYNKPVFCLKDARRLRDQIFGDGKNKSQFEKIERRRSFLMNNIEFVRKKLDWPDPSPDLPPTFHEVYLSRYIYWCLRNPTYKVPTEFVRIDGFENWLQNKGLL